MNTNILLRSSCFVLFVIIILYGSLTTGKDNQGAEYRTIEAYTYGRFEVRAKSMQKEGLLSTFFTYHEFSLASEWNEIDFEILGRYSNDVQFNTITANNTSHLRHQPVDFNPHMDYHIYAFEWTPDYVAWFIDGVEMYKQTGFHISTLIRPQQIMMNVWNPGYPNWVGTIINNSLPGFAYYDWCSYHSYTPGSGNYGTGNNFTHDWTDEFDSFNPAKWERATHSWGGNRSQFVEENVYFEDGHLVLCLTSNDNPGFVDIQEPFIDWVRAYKSKKVQVRFTEEIDEETAEIVSNYIISGVSISSANLLSDQRTVELITPNIDLNSSYNLIVLSGIKDLANPPNIATAKSKMVYMPNYEELPIKINAGGTTFNDFIDDQEWGPDYHYGHLDGRDLEYGPIEIGGTDLDEIYQTDRTGIVKYLAYVPNGEYKITLMMSENFVNQPGSRVFDVFINNIKIEEDLDIFSIKGKNTAYTKIANVLVNDELIEISFAAEVGEPILNGLIIEQISAVGVNDQIKNPKDYKLYQNYPNPFNPSTQINYTLSEKALVSLSIYDLIGNEINSLVNSVQSAGVHKLIFDASQYPSGIYFYKLTADGSDIATKKMVFLK